MSEHVNAAYHLVDRHVDSGDGGRTAVRSQGTSTSYAELQELSRAFAGGLRGLSVRRGDRVVFVCSDRLELAVGILGALRYGAVAVPLSTMLTGPELAKIVQDSGARVLVVTPEFGPAVTVAVAGATELEHVVVVNEAQVQVPTHLTVTPWSALLAAGGALGEPVAPIGADFPALWLYTSGTTGTPKGAMHRHANLRAVCDTYARDVLQVTPQDVFFSVAKIFFAYGIGNSLLFPLSVGATSVLASQRPSPQLVLSRLREDEPTLFFAGPTFYAALLAADLPDDTFRSVRLCASAGEALPASLYRRFTERFGVDVLDGIGSTEALHIFLSNRPGAVRAGTSGNVVPGYELQVRDEAGQLVPDGEPGALFVRGASMATGYWCRTDASREVFQGEWVRTGDTYVRSSDGYYTCLGRANDLLKAGGIWVSPAEVEERLLQHPDVAEAAVVGVADSNELDKPVAFVVARPGAQLDGDQLVGWCREGLAAFKRPRAVVVVSELPKTATGKVQRFRLREQAGSDLLDAPPGPSVASGTPVASL